MWTWTIALLFVAAAAFAQAPQQNAAQPPPPQLASPPAQVQPSQPMQGGAGAMQSGTIADVMRGMAAHASAREAAINQIEQALQSLKANNQ